MWPEQVRCLLARVTMPPAGHPLSCAVSGGPDSLALMVLAVASGCRVTAFHVDHGLRAGSAEEAAFVAAAAERLGASFESLRAEVADGPNLEARARKARFAVLPGEVATGHTMDDQAETVLLNLLRGAAIDGLAGMTAGPRHPLLSIRRHETQEVCRSVGLEWLVDPSNIDPRFRRNRVRHELLVLCNDIAGRDVVPVLARQAQLMGEDRAVLDQLALELVPDPSDCRQLARAPQPVARRAVRRWLRREHPPTLGEVQRVLRVAQGDVVATEVSDGLRVARSKGRLVVGRETPAPMDGDTGPR